jgi:hypothetical protein
MRDFVRPLAWTASALCALCVAGGSRAEDAPVARPADETVEAIEARKLFLEGRTLLEQGQARAACDSLRRSHDLVPALATLLNLGLCYAHAGRLATAHEYYRQAEVMATLVRDARRRDFAHDAAAALAARRASLTLRIEGRHDPALQVQLDDSLKPREVWEHPMYIDAGEHRISVQSTDEQTWHGSVTVVDGSKHVLVIPEFQRRPASAPPPAPAELQGAPETVPSKVAPKAQTREPALRYDTGSSTTGRIVALSVGGAGVIALGTSLAYAIAARTKFDDSNDFHCRPSSGTCSPEGLRLRERAQADAGLSTAFAIGGGAAVLGGFVLWFVLQPDESGSLPFEVDVRRDAVTASWTARL